MKKLDRKYKASAAFLALLLIIPLIGPYLIRHDPYAVNMKSAFLKPCREYLFGTDNLGRCVFCRMIAGSRTSIYTALLIVGIVFVVGTLIGMTAGLTGGIVDEVLMKITLVFQAFPAFMEWCARTLCGVLDDIREACEESCRFHERRKLYACRENERCAVLSSGDGIHFAQYYGEHGGDGCP